MTNWYAEWQRAMETILELDLRLVSLVGREAAEGGGESDNRALECIAHMLYVEAADRAGQAPFWWLCLAESEQDEFLGRARKVIDDWWRDELAARDAREMPERTAEICQATGSEKDGNSTREA